jgi:hypothetical protein
MRIPVICVVISSLAMISLRTGNTGRIHAQQCGPCPEECGGGASCPLGFGTDWDPCSWPGGCPQGQVASGTCCCDISPILIDMEGDGFALTGPRDGVSFSVAPSIDGSRRLYRMSWTAPEVDDSWLALDRNGNRVIDDLTELFGNVTSQPPGQSWNGFRALAVFDEPEHGGRKDGRIDSRDAIYPRLVVWRDYNHNGYSERFEMRSLPAAGIEGIDLDYKESRRTDDHGNQFRYRAKIYATHGSGIGRWAWDVFLRLDNPVRTTGTAVPKLTSLSQAK